MLLAFVPEYKHFGTMHILNTKRGIYYIADTLINRMPNAEALVDITRLAHHSVKFFNDDPRNGNGIVL